MRSSPAPSVPTRHSAFRLLLVQIDATTMADTRFRNTETVQKWIDDSISAKPKYLSQHVIAMLPERCEKVVENDGTTE